VTVKLIGVHYRKSPLVQSGIEIPCKIKTQIPGTVSNLLVMERYKQLVEELYIEPKEELILGSFIKPYKQATTEEEKDGQNHPRGSDKKSNQSPKRTVGMKDVKSFFTQAPAPKEKRSRTNNIEID